MRLAVSVRFRIKTKKNRPTAVIEFYAQPALNRIAEPYFRAKSLR
jgi:hypothetical protein